MRKTDTQDGLTALAVAGSHVVLLGWDMDAGAISAEGPRRKRSARLR